MVDAYENWREERPLERRSDERADGRLERRGPRRSEPRFEQRLDQWVSAGRQLVDGVSGARPGTRAGGRSSGLKLDHLGRWVEDKLDWLLEDDEGWHESWEQQPPQPRAAAAASPSRPSRAGGSRRLCRLQPARPRPLTPRTGPQTRASRSTVGSAVLPIGARLGSSSQQSLLRLAGQCRVPRAAGWIQGDAVHGRGCSPGSCSRYRAAPHSPDPPNLRAGPQPSDQRWC